MREKIDFIGRKYSEKELASATKALNKWEASAGKPIEGEEEKTPEEKWLILKLQDILAKELESLGIENCDILNEDSIHLLTADLFEKRFPKSSNNANYDSGNREIFLNKERTNTKVRMISTLLHEMIHSASRQKFYIDNKKGITEARVGYRVYSDWKEGDRSNRLRGFNEAMTDYTVYKLLVTNIEDLRDLGIKEEDVRGPIYSYLADYQPIVDSILEKIAADKNISSLEAFNKLERGQFENTLLALKDIDRLFGEGSLEILSYLGEFKDKKRSNVDRAIRNYFGEADSQARKSIGDNIRSMVSS